jgi:hypothetical protein
MGNPEKPSSDADDPDELYKLLQAGLAARRAIEPTDPTSLDDAEMYLGLLDGALADNQDSDPSN